MKRILILLIVCFFAGNSYGQLTSSILFPPVQVYHDTTWNTSSYSILVDTKDSGVILSVSEFKNADSLRFHIFNYKIIDVVSGKELKSHFFYTDYDQVFASYPFEVREQLAYNFVTAKLKEQ